MAKQLLCTRCLTVGKPKMETRGSLGTEIVLWLLMVLPALLYSLWRLTTRRPAYRACGSPDLIPPTSPRARQLLAQSHADAGT